MRPMVVFASKLGASTPGRRPPGMAAAVTRGVGGDAPAATSLLVLLLLALIYSVSLLENHIITKNDKINLFSIIL